MAQQQVKRATGIIFLVALATSATFVCAFALKLLLAGGVPDHNCRLERLWQLFAFANAGAPLVSLPMIVAILGAFFIGRDYVRRDFAKIYLLEIAIILSFVALCATLLLYIFIPVQPGIISDEWLSVAQAHCERQDCGSRLIRGSANFIGAMVVWFVLILLSLVYVKFDVTTILRQLMGAAQ